MLQRITLQTSLIRPIRSFVERKGRISSLDMPIFEKMWPIYGLSLENKKLDIEQIFGRGGPTTLEIGFGNGRSLLQMACDNPQHNFIGIEVYKAGIVKLLVGIHKLGLTNIRVFCADAIEVLNNCICDESIAAVQLFFPDPWPKARHHKRRIIQPEFAKLIHAKLRTDGTFHMATDWEEYALHMLDVMETQQKWINTAGPLQFAPRPETRPLTKFEQRGHRLGYGTWDLIFRKSCNI